MFLLKLAVLNIQRNPRRSVITVLAVSVGLASLIFLWAFMDGYQDAQRDNACRLFTGHVQIHALGFQKKVSPEMVLPEREKILEHLKGMKNVNAVTERVRAEALIGTTANSRGMMLIGIDPEREEEVTDIHEYVKEGLFIFPGEDREVVIGSRLADKIEVKAGDKVVIMTQAMDGTLAGYSYHVKGILSTGTAIDEIAVFVTLSSAQELLGVEKNTQEIVISLKSRAAIPGFVSELKGYLDPSIYEIITWDQIIPEINQWANWSGAVIQTMLVIVMFVIGVGIMNTVLMSIFERTKELGVMMAIGTSPRQIVSLIFLETLVIEAAGILFGVIAGFFLVFYFQQVGIRFHGFEDAARQAFMSNVVYPEIHLSRVLYSIKMLVIVTSVISCYPAVKASRMEPVKAIYHS